MGSTPSREDQLLILAPFLKKSSFQIENFFPSWKTTGKTYMIPSAPVIKYQAPVDLEASGFDAREYGKNKPIIRGEKAEAIVYKFLATSKQHAFILQNFTTTRWRRILKSRGYHISTTFGKKMEAIGNIEIDFLILHSNGIVIAIECKNAEQFYKSRYCDCKKQLNNLDVLLKHVCDLISLTLSGTPMKIETRKVVSFPFVEMRQDTSDPHNLGSKDLTGDSQQWWNRVLPQNGLEVNQFETNTFYQKFVSLLIGMYCANELSVGQNIFNIQETIRSQTFYKGCSNSSVIERKVEEMTIFEDFLFLNPEQQNVLECTNARLVISGEVGTGKTVLLMQKALMEMLEKQHVVFLVPKCLEAKYLYFSTKYENIGTSRVYTHETISDEILKSIEDCTIFIDECQHLLFVDQCKWKKHVSKGSFNVPPFSCAFENLFEFICSRRCKTTKTVIVFSVSILYDFFEGIFKKTLQTLIDLDYKIFRLASVVRGTCAIIYQWRSFYPQIPSIFHTSDKCEKSKRSVLGHNIIGCPVDRRSTTSEKLFEQLFEIIIDLKHYSDTMGQSSKKLWPTNVCILLNHEELLDRVKDNLQVNGIEVGSITDQMGHDHILAVDCATNSLSYEWSVVIAIFPTYEADVASFHYRQKLAMSRAISKLYYLEIS